MARLNINIGTTSNDKTGDPLRTAFDKVNQNFVELYSSIVSEQSSRSSLINGDKEVVLGSTGLTQFPAVDGDSLFIQGPEIGSENSTIAISAKDNILITADILGETPKQWQFNTTGDLSVPGNITKTSGNLEITAENYVVIDSTNGGQIDIGANQSGEGSGDSGPILMGHAGNTLDIQSGKIRVNSAVPTHSTGALNDVVGLVAFDGSYIYYCTADYVPVEGGGASVSLVPGQLGQSVNSITVDKSGPSNSSWADLQVGWTLTVDSTTVTVEEVTDDLTTVYIVVSGFITLPMTGAITFTETGGVQPNIWKRISWSGDTW